MSCSVQEGTVSPVEWSSACFLCILYHFRSSKMADGQFVMGFHRTLLGSSLFAHTTPFRSTCRTSCNSWKRFVSICRLSQGTVGVPLLYWQHKSVHEKPYIFSVDPNGGRLI